MVADTAINLKPRGVMELFDQAIRLYRNNFFKFVGIIAVAQVPLQVVQLLINILFFRGTLNESYTPGSSYLGGQSLGVVFATLIIAFLSFILVSGMATAALTRAITDSYLGESVSIGGAYRKIKGSWGPLLVAMILVMIFAILLLIWAIVPCVGWLTGFGMLVFLSLVVSPLIAPIIVIEQRSSGSAIRRAWELARRRFWWLTGFFVLLTLFNLLVVQGPVQIVTVAIQSYLLRTISTANMLSASMVQTISTSVLALILSLLYVPLASTCATLAYFDLRVRQEGFDLALMANQMDGAPVNAMELASQAPAAAAGPLVTWLEMGYFVLFSFGVAAIYAVLTGIYMVIVMAVMGGAGL